MCYSSEVDCGVLNGLEQMNGPVGLSRTKNWDVCPVTQGTRWGFQRIQPLCGEPEQPEHGSSVAFRSSLLLGWCFEVLFADWWASFEGSEQCIEV